MLLFIAILLFIGFANLLAFLPEGPSTAKAGASTNVEVEPFYHPFDSHADRLLGLRGVGYDL